MSSMRTLAATVKYVDYIFNIGGDYLSNVTVLWKPSWLRGDRHGRVV